MLHLEISGNDINDEHPLNKKDILLILVKFHLEISGKDNSDEHP